MQAGTYSNGTNCIACLAGYSCADPTIGSEQCADGKYQTAIGQTSCDDCPAGQECPTKDGSPVNCADGTYSGIGESTCTVSVLSYSHKTNVFLEYTGISLSVRLSMCVFVSLQNTANFVADTTYSFAVSVLKLWIH